MQSIIYPAITYLKTDINRCPISKTIKNYLRDANNLAELNDIDFSNEMNCLICAYKILTFFKDEYDEYRIKHKRITFNKNKIDSMVILKKKNIIFKILLKCVENFSIDQELKDEAKEMIENTAKYNRAKFLIEEKEEMESIWKKLVCRLKNIQELQNHNLLDELISPNQLPTDDPAKWPFKNEQLIQTKSEIAVIVRSMHISIYDYIYTFFLSN